MRAPVTIQSSDFWVKLIDMLQQNWALIDEGPESTARVFFVTDVSGVFDEMTFPSKNNSPSNFDYPVYLEGAKSMAAQPLVAIFSNGECGVSHTVLV